MLGSKSAQAIEDMVGYAQETQHEKILRGLAVGIALVMYGRMEEADALIESLCRDKVKLKSLFETYVKYEINNDSFSNNTLSCSVLVLLHAVYVYSRDTNRMALVFFVIEIFKRNLDSQSTALKKDACVM